MTDQRFGCEIEVVGTDRSRVLEGFRELGVDCANEGYTHRITNSWKLVDDSSIIPHGFEVVSPILQGEQGRGEVYKVAKMLADKGCKVNKSCGFHVHVDARDLTFEEIVNVAKRYQLFEREIDTFMPASRRQNNHCKSMEEFFRYSNMSTLHGDKSRLSRLDRYYKVNISAYARHGTVEFRQHSGTVNAEKMVNWIKFCLGFVQSSMGGATVSPDQSGRLTKKQERLLKLFDLFASRDNYYPNSSDQIAQTVGISQLQVPSYISELRRLSGLRIGCNSARSYRPGSYYTTNTGTRPQFTPRTRAPRPATQTRRNARLQKAYSLFVERGTISKYDLARAMGCSESSTGGLVSSLRREYGCSITFQRYRGYRLGCTAQWTPATAPQPQPRATTRARRTQIIAVPNDTVFRGIETEVQNYYSERASELS